MTIESENDSPLTMEDQIFSKTAISVGSSTLELSKCSSQKETSRPRLSEIASPSYSKVLKISEKRLIEKDLFRINRKFIVNLKEVVHIEPWFNRSTPDKTENGRTARSVAKAVRKV